MKETISVIVPLYYGKRYIPDMILQLENCADNTENYKIQLIFSNDSPEQKIEDKYDSAKICIKVIHADNNAGIHKARVRGLQNSDGEYILFLDQDDRITPDYFKCQLSKIGTADAVVCNAVSGDRIKYDLDRPLWKAVSRHSMVNEGNMILSPGQVLLRRSAIPKSWIENIIQENGADDWFLWLCMHSERKRFAIAQEALFIREVHYYNASSNSRKMALSEQEAIRMIEEESILQESERKILKALLPKLQEKRIKENEKWRQMFLILNDWFRVCNCGKSIALYLKKKYIKKIAIYGYGYLGKTLLENMESEDFEVAYIIDKNAAFLNLDKKCRTLEEPLGSVDGVIISLLRDSLPDENDDPQAFKGRISSGHIILERKIRQKVETDVIWLEDIIACMK